MNTHQEQRPKSNNKLSIWLTLIWFFIASALFVAGQKLEEDLLTISGAILMAALHIIYFPVVSIIVIRRNDEQSRSVINFLGLYSIFAFVTSVFFKLYHVPGAAIYIILGVFVFSIIFIPSWFFLNWRNLDKWGRLLAFIFSSFMGSFMLYWLFKTQFWPGATVLSEFAYSVFFYALVPLFILVFLFSRKSIRLKLSDALIFSFVFAYLFSGVQTGKMVMRGMARSTENQMQEEKKLDNYLKKNRFLYESLLSSSEKDTLFITQKLCAQKLRQKTDSVFNYIRKIKAILVSECDGISLQVADTLPFEKIEAKDNFDIVTLLLIGNQPENPKKDPYSAIDLKRVLEEYKTSVVELAPEEVRKQLESNSTIDLSDTEYEDGFREGWETNHFYHESLGKTYTFLSILQNDVRYTEQLVLSEIYNKANFSRKDNIAAQLADITAKYESEKQEKQIALLEKDKEVSAVKLQAKDAEISDREKTITYFVLAMIAFILMLVFVVRSNLLRKEANKKLEEQNTVITEQKNLVEQQKHLVEEKQREIVDSINYAKRIQYTLLAHDDFMRHYLENYFVFFHPKDIVSGDFYWASFVKNENNQFGRFYLAVCDSTGHGVPGAFMSLLNISFLNEAINEKGIVAPNEVFNYVRQQLIVNISKEGQKDGFDGILLCLNTETKELSYAAANNAPVLINNNGDCVELEKDRMPVGIGERSESFTLYTLKHVPGESLYLYTDGYADQFGGEKGKKFKYKQLNDLILNNYSLSLDEQEQILRQKFENWRGNLEQVDDVCVVGIRL